MPSELARDPLVKAPLRSLQAYACSREAWDNAARFFGAAEAQAERAGLRRDAADEAFLAPLMAKASKRSATTSFTTSWQRRPAVAVSTKR